MKKITITYQQANLPKVEMEERRHKAFELLFEEVLRIEKLEKNERNLKRIYRREVSEDGAVR